MTDYTTVIATAKALIAEDAAYTTRPTKASSARLRGHINNIKRLGTNAKRELMEADKK